ELLVGGDLEGGGQDGLEAVEGGGGAAGDPAGDAGDLLRGAERGDRPVGLVDRGGLDAGAGHQEPGQLDLRGRHVDHVGAVAGGRAGEVGDALQGADLDSDAP